MRTDAAKATGAIDVIAPASGYNTTWNSTESSGAHTHSTSAQLAHVHTIASSDTHNHTIYNNGSHTHSVNQSYVGGSSSHTNIPPYTTVYYWIRTA